MSYHVSFSFSSFVSFLAIFQVIQCEFLNFFVGQFTHHIPGPTVGISHFFTFFSGSRHLPGNIVFLSHFPRFSVFLPKSRYYSVYFTFHTFVTVYRHISCPTLNIFLICQFSCHIPDPTMCGSHLRFYFSFLATIQVLWCTFLILHVFQCFSQYYR
jgi:hypothetical protein